MSQPRPVAVIVLAAGEGTRMRSRTPKVLHAVCGRSCSGTRWRPRRGLGPQHLVVVVGHGREQVGAHLARSPRTCGSPCRTEQGGTGHAVRMVTEAGSATCTGTVVVTYGDMPLLRAQTLAALVA